MGSIMDATYSPLYSGTQQSHIHHRSLGAADEIVDRFANLHLDQNPAFFTTHVDDYDYSLFDNLTVTGDYLTGAFFYDENLTPALWKELAGVALEKYRQTQGVEFELVGEVWAISLDKSRESCFHLRFQAKSNGDSPVQFFAEVFRTKEDARHGACYVSCCDIMDPSDPDLVKGCYLCTRQMLHPKGIEFFKFPPPKAYV